LGIVDRIKLNARANINHILDKAENPQKMLNQFLLEMQGSVREVKEAVATAIVGVKKLEREISSYAEKASEWEERALLALRKDNEELARKALEQKQVYAEKERTCKTELEKQKQTVEELKGSLLDMEARLEELLQKRLDLIKQYEQMKRRTAQTPVTRPVASELDIDTSVIDIYDRMVDRVRTMEAQAEALAELAEMDNVEAEFQKLERETSVEAELKAMKAKTQT
jgi:phage shock protein A